jgi:hypothetical protein
MRKARQFRYQAVRIGLIGGIVELFLALIGMVEAFSQRDIIYNVISMGQTLLLVAAVFPAYLAAKRAARLRPLWILGNGLVAGLMMGASLALLVAVGNFVRLRAVFINASPALYQLLTFGYGFEIGAPLLLIAGALSGTFGGLLYVLPGVASRMLVTSLCGVLITDPLSRHGEHSRRRSTRYSSRPMDSPSRDPRPCSFRLPSSSGSGL